MFKYIFILLLASNVNAQECSETESLVTEPVSYSVNTTIPKHLVGATICITLSGGGSSCVPSEKFMIVPRKQVTVLGENKTVTKAVKCSRVVQSPSKKNMVFADVRKDHRGLDIKTEGSTASVESKKGLVPSINYYRRELLDSPVGAGLGIDTNGTVKGTLGLDF